MAKRWSKLQSEIYNLLDKRIDIQIHYSAYRMKSNWGSTDLPRYWITLGKEIIFDYPQQFLDEKSSDYDGKRSVPVHQTVKHMYYPYTTDISAISEMIREYINAPTTSLLTYDFEYDDWGLTDIMKASDRRISKKKLAEHFQDTKNEAVRKILQTRKIL